MRLQKRETGSLCGLSVVSTDYVHGSEFLNKQVLMFYHLKTRRCVIIVLLQVKTFLIL